MPKIPTNVRGARFTGWGTALGHETITNDDLAKTIDTSDEWDILIRIGNKLFALLRCKCSTRNERLLQVEVFAENLQTF